MASYFNIIRFGGAAVELESPLRFTAGLRPDAWRARLGYVEYARISAQILQQQPMDLVFSYSGAQAADVTVANVRVVEMEATRYGAPQGGAVQVLEYRLYLCDFREGFVAPRGGRLKLGLVNPSAQNTDPSDAVGEGDEDDDPGSSTDGDDGSPLPISELMQICLTAMGIGSTDIDDDVDNVDPPMDLKWFGNHAPSELEKLLKKAGAVFCPHLDGTASIEMPGKGAVPTLQNPLPSLDLGGIDRRGKTLVVTSYPNPIINTVTLSGPNSNTFDFCLTGADGKTWEWLSQSTVVSDPVATVKSGLTNIAAAVRDQVGQQLYRCLRVNPDTYPPESSPILALVVNPDLSTSPLVAQAKTLTQSPQGLYQASTSLSTVPVQMRFPRAGVLMLSHAVGNLFADPSQGFADPYHDFTPCKDGDVTLTFSYETTTTDGSGNTVHQYYERGFQGGIGGVTPLSDSDTENALSDPDTVVVTDPSLQVIQQNGTAQNQSDVESRATAIATAYLAGSSAAVTPRQIGCVGFFGCDLSGVVQELSIDQRQVMTWLKLNTWFRPLGAYSSQEWAELEEGSAHPHASSTAANKTALGSAGYTQPVLAVSPPIVSQPPATKTFQINSAATGGGQYYGVDIGSPATWNVNAELNMPEGGHVGTTNYLIVNLPENQISTHRLGTQSGNIFVTGRLVGTLGDGTPIAEVDSCACGATQGVSIGSPSITSQPTLEAAQTNAVEECRDQLIEDTRLVRIAYNPSGDANLYAYYRTYQYACGMLAGVTSEIRVTIFGTEACS